MSYAVRANRRVSAADGRWLLLAIMLHALLLLVPVREHFSGASDSAAELVVRLLAAQRPADAPERETREETASPAPPVEVEQPVTSRPATVVMPEEELDEPETAADALQPTLTLARLMELRDSVTERVPLDEPARTDRLNLGEAKPFERPGNWRPNAGAEALAPFDNTFNDETVPTETEVVDRWLAADGSHRVVVETPDGLRWCGRADAWDPMRPLVEPVMHWRVCGGDGKGEWKFKPREPLDRDFIVPVAKDATEP